MTRVLLGNATSKKEGLGAYPPSGTEGEGKTGGVRLPLNDLYECVQFFSTAYERITVVREG